MNAASATVSACAAQPDLTRAGARASATLNAFAVLVALVFTLTDHGKHLALAFRAHVAQPGHGRTGRFCQTGTINIIRTNLRRAMMRSVALYQALRHQANRALALPLPALRADRTRPEQAAANARPGQAGQDSARAKATHPEWWQNADPSYTPTAQPVADELSRRAAGAILPPISLIFADTTETAGAVWGNLTVPINRPGFRRTRFIAEVDWCQAPASRVGTPRLGRPSSEHHRPNCLSAAEQLRDRPPPQAESAECASSQAEPCAASTGTSQQTETAPAMQWPVLPCPAQEVAAPASL
ncbi:MAG TPA: hypothetical protein VMU81_12150 [Acetobacteraceae bacterium]|nr:hypothetical protein [Acetobacteraceae bacterium]